MTGPSNLREAGFTLIEVVISLALFALISLAGLALIDSVMRVEQGTSGRLERLGQLQRTMYVLARDFEQLSVGTLEQVNGGVRFQRNPASLDEAGRPISYTFGGDALLRSVGTEAPAAAPQLLLTGVSSISWRFFFRGRGWQDRIALDERGVPEQPAAIAVELLLDEKGAPSGSLRRVIELPTPPAPEPVPIPVPAPATAPEPLP